MVRKLDAEIRALDGTKLAVVAQTKAVNHELAELRKQVVITEEAILMQSFGLYAPRYEFANSDAFKERLSTIRTSQKELIKQGSAASGSESFTYNGKASLGTKMVKDMHCLAASKLLYFTLLMHSSHSLLNALSSSFCMSLTILVPSEAFPL